MSVVLSTGSALAAETAIVACCDLFHCISLLCCRRSKASFASAGDLSEFMNTDAATVPSSDLLSFFASLRTCLTAFSDSPANATGSGDRLDTVVVSVFLILDHMQFWLWFLDSRRLSVRSTTRRFPGDQPCGNACSTVGHIERIYDHVHYTDDTWDGDPEGIVGPHPLDCRTPKTDNQAQSPIYLNRQRAHLVFDIKLSVLFL